MPQKRSYRNRRRPKRFRRRVKKVYARGLRPATLPLTREKTTCINTSDPGTLPAQWVIGTHVSEYWLQANLKFQVSELPNATEFAALFREYRLNCVVVKITPMYKNNENRAITVMPDQGSYYGGNLMMYARRDRLGRPLLTTDGQDYWDEQQAKISKVLPSDRAFTFKIYPKAQRQIVDTPETHAFGLGKAIWLPTTQMEVPHYGLNMAFAYNNPQIPYRLTTTVGVSSGLVFKVTYKYYISLRGVH